jgi:pimeloyl-ACP methyl ester carboxylesterase
VLDLQQFAGEWGVDLAAIRAPARMWIGTADTAVPLSAARVLARAIPACALTELHGDGHFWVAESYGEVLAWVAATLRARTEAGRLAREPRGTVAVSPR